MLIIIILGTMVAIKTITKIQAAAAAAAVVVAVVVAVVIVVAAGTTFWSREKREYALY